LRALALPLLLPVLCWQPARPAPGQFELLAADVGQGSAVLVRTATHSLLYDAGPRYGRAGVASDAGQRVLVPLLRALGERLDMLMLSHRDADHIGGAAAVLAQQPQARLVGSVMDETALLALLALRPAAPCLAGQRWVWDGVAFEVLHPQAQDAAAPVRAKHSNASSCVLRIRAAAVGSGARGASAAALLVGDIELAQEQALLARGAPVAADWLLAAHHGSKSSSGAAFLDAVHPRTVMVQAGYRNRYGHPAPEVLARYVERHIRVVESTRCGAASWTSAAPDEVRCERTQRQHYWAHALPPRE
ncbi:MAG: ComEC/Rec2 family competence protein, partial [Pseudomonadota bacterium]